MPKTQLKKLTIEKFRALNDVAIEFIDNLSRGQVTHGKVSILIFVLVKC